MATIVKTIGTAGGRDYTTVQAWEDALPASGAAGTSYEGDCYNDSEFVVAGTVVTFSGTTLDTGQVITLTTGAGQSFRDNANVQTNALHYNASNGVGIKSTGSYTPAINIVEAGVNLIGLQVQSAIFVGGDNEAVLANGATPDTEGFVGTNCILEGKGTSSGGSVVHCASGTYTNLVCIIRSGNGNGFFLSYPVGVVIQNCTLVKPSNLPANDFGIATTGASTSTVKNCAIFGFSDDVDTDSKYTGNNNCSDKAIGFGSTNQASKAYASQFQNTIDVTIDFRLKTGADCVDNGATITAANPDIAGTTRPSGSTYDIGCWELVQAAVSVTVDMWFQEARRPYVPKPEVASY